MNTLKLFRQSLTGSSELKEAKKMPFWKVIFYILFLSIISALPLVNQVLSVIDDVKSDGQEIAEKLPDFTIENGELNVPTDTKGFIYQTNSIIFTFDPQEKRTESDILQDATTSAIGIAFLKDKLFIALSDTSTTEDILGTDQFSFPYANGSLDNFESKTLKRSLEQAEIPLWLNLIIFAVALYPAFLNLLINILLITIGANLYSRLRLYQLRFFDCLKIVVYAMTLPVLLSTLLHFFLPGFDDSFLMILFSLVVFFLAVRTEEPLTPPGI